MGAANSAVGHSLESFLGYSGKIANGGGGEPEISIEIRRCPGHSEIEGNERVGKAGSRRTRLPWRGVVWLKDRYGGKRMPPHLKRGFSEAKWMDQLVKTKNSKHRPSDKQKPDPECGRANKRLASRFYQLKTGHCLTGQYLSGRREGETPDAGASTRPRHLFKNCPQWKSQLKTL